MKDIRKTQRALSLIDERFIDEAADPRLLSKNKSRVLPIALAGTLAAACAAVLCVALIKGAPKRSVSLLPAQTPAVSSETAETHENAQAHETADTADAPDSEELSMPEVIALPEVTRGKASSIIFGSEFPSVVWADDTRAAFTDIGEDLFVYDFNGGGVVFCADVKSALDNVRGELVDVQFGMEGWNGIAFGELLTADGSEIGVSFHCADNSTTYFYTLDMLERCLRRAYGSQGFFQYVNDDADTSELMGLGMSGRCVTMGDGYVAAFLDYSSAESSGFRFDLEHTLLKRFTLTDGAVEITDSRKPCDESFFESLTESENNESETIIESVLAEFLLSENGTEFRKTASRAAMAFLRNDKEELSIYLADSSYDAGLSEGGSDILGGLEYMVMKFPSSETSDGIYPVVFEYVIEGVDMNMYLDLGLRETDSGWKVEYIYAQG